MQPLPGNKLPVNPDRKQGRVAYGYVTPEQDRVPQVMSIPPKRVLPVIFIPGIMGSNLRMSAARQKELKQPHNIAWRPDNLSVSAAQYNDSPKERQRRLDPNATELDIYNPEDAATGNPTETTDTRNSAVYYPLGYGGYDRLDGPLLQSDLPGTEKPRTREQKARERGWGEVYFSSYADILCSCERHLNGAFSDGTASVYLKKFVLGVNPTEWQAHKLPLQSALDETTLRDTVRGCWFPVHAMGYNWLKGNEVSGTAIAKRIEALIARYQSQGFQCEKVILVTHSMGGLVARAAIHPAMGKLNDKVLGIVHGVMPAMGAGAAYKRVRCGFEGNSISSKILGNTGSCVTPVLGNSQGGLELLPNQDYGNGWLQVKQDGRTLKSLPVKGDPYEEIYKVPDKWFGLLREEWINPAEADGSGFMEACRLLDRAKSFHKAIRATYHFESYGHYGADPKRATWKNVVWEIDNGPSTNDVDFLRITADDAKGQLHLTDPNLQTKRELRAKLLDPAEPGDQTVPLHSADAQLLTGKFKGIFRQTGYEHQASYSDSAVVASTIYSLIRIAAQMKWSK
ncbi:MAG: hypothetical protein V4633_14520 [Pseudomonadota bacterium]